MHPQTPRFLAALATYSDTDNCELRYRSLTTTGVQVRVEEDTTFDPETTHGAEAVHYLVFAGSGGLRARVWGSGDEVRRYYHLGGQRVAMRVSGASPSSQNGVYYLHTDHLGSTSLVTTGEWRWVGGAPLGAGSVWTRQLYAPYGAVRYVYIRSGPAPTDYGYTGQRATGLGLMDYRARWYIPALGRFASADTLVPGVGGRALNRYMYVGGNPLSFSDPTGHWMNQVVHDYQDAGTPSPLADTLIYRILANPVCPYCAAVSEDYGQWMGEHPGYRPEDDWFLATVETALAEGGTFYGLGAADVQDVYVSAQLAQVDDLQAFGGIAAQTGPPLFFGMGMSHLEIAGSAQVAVMAMRSPVRNPNGRTGSPEHQAALAQQQEAVLHRGEGWTWDQEVHIRTPGGSRPYRFADGGAFYNNELVELYQVGRSTRAGWPVARERYAIADMLQFGQYDSRPIDNVPIYFISYR